MMTAIAKPITTMPSVEPGWETGTGLGVGVGACAAFVGALVGAANAPGFESAAGDGCPGCTAEGERARVKATPAARISTGNKKRRSALFMTRSV